MEGSSDMRRVCDTYKKAEDMSGEDDGIWLKYTLILSKHRDLVNVHCVDVQLNPTSPGMS